MLEWWRGRNRLACQESPGRSRLVRQQTYKRFTGAASLDLLQSFIPYLVRVSQVALGKPGLWPALVLKTVLRKPCGQLPLAGVREAEVSDVPELLDPPEVELPGLPEPLEDPDDPEAARLGPALLAMVLEGEEDSREDGETRFSPALA